MTKRSPGGELPSKSPGVGTPSFPPPRYWSTMRRPRDSEWMTLRRCLALLQRLLRGPATKADLIEAVRANVGAEAYVPNAETERISALQKDLRERLPQYLGAEVRFDRRAGVYELAALSGLPGFDLSDEALAALAFLEDAFQAGAPNHEKVTALRNHLLACLPEDRRRQLTRQRVAPRVDLRRLDAGIIAQAVEERVERALISRRLLRFSYRSPLYEDGLPRRHTVEPYELTFDTKRRHQYLYAFCRRMEGPEGSHEVQQYIYYRLDRILADGIEVMESKLGPVAPRGKRYELVYRLTPAVARLGEVTQHFEEMQVTLEADGSAEVRAETNNLFFAVRTLLHYGQNCQVLGGPEALREMQEIVQEMAKMYETS